MSLKHVITGALLFGAGVLSANRIKQFTAAIRTDEPVPIVRVAYTSAGSFVNGEKVYANRIGEPRCDWNDIAPTEREQFVMADLQQNSSMLARYLTNVPAADVRKAAYLSLLQLARRSGTSVAAEADSMRAALGYRWNMQWEQREPGRE